MIFEWSLLSSKLFLSKESCTLISCNLTTFNATIVQIQRLFTKTQIQILI